ncbi:TRNA/rRNA methyltransferase family protein [Hibiscus syriacus]|uniref:tRNA/rRNA methyltransferase family protein n=1 Tax=Hibiscus syriacus TaxID=106335 RepID=A0A6A2XGU9_HIBSY|nr:TRNA/rRNA methyltransferase family protein [Hibiscus syriacus]
MGHLTPFLRLTSMLLSHDCKLTLITVIPTVSAAESSHISSFLSQQPEINHIEFYVPPAKHSDTISDGPFFIIFEAISLGKVAVDLGVHNYAISTTSLNFLSLMAYLPILTKSDAAQLANGADKIEIPGLTPLPLSSVPPPFFSADHGFTATLLSNPVESVVVLLSFGSRTAMSRDQIRELRDGLERSGIQFLWVLKTKKVDKDGNEEDLEEILGSSFLESTKDRGIVLKEWVNQQDVLGHSAIGGFVSHRGWNSVMEAARNGVPMLAWPQHGDQRTNAEVLEKAGVGIWDRTWGWGNQRLVKEGEIRRKISELMKDGNLKIIAKMVGEEARKTTGNGGNSKRTIIETIAPLKQNMRN